MSKREREVDWLALEGTANTRVVVPGVLLRSDNLQSLTERDVRLLVDGEGVEVVVDLRTDVEVELEGPGPMTREPGVRVEHRSLHPDSGGNTDLEIDTVRPWQQDLDEESVGEVPVVRAYLSYLSSRPDSVVGAIRTIAGADGAVLVHCAAGKDRTGVIVALALAAVGVERDVIVADYLASREPIEAVLARLLSSPTYRAELEGRTADELAPKPGTMERVLEILDARLGGAGAWLVANGLDREDSERLRRRLMPAGVRAAAR